MQRALRLNSEIGELWLAYFRLELMYLEQIKERRNQLLASNDDRTIEHQNPLAGFSLGQEEQTNSKHLDDTQQSDQGIGSNNQGFELFMKDLVPRIIYRNAIQGRHKWMGRHVHRSRYVHAPGR
jgi:hypothetical protein